MDSSKKPWPVTTVCGIRDRVNEKPDFQRPAVWTKAQKQLLIDTILRDYDIPKFYWRKMGSKPDRYDVVDGQQRLLAIWQFHRGEFALPTDVEPVDGLPIASLKYADLPDELRKRFDIYPLDIVVLSETDEDEVREMFLRLQNGTTLKAQERRNAMPGKMRDFVRTLAGHPFFANCAFSNSRYAFDHIAAQMTLTELEGGPCNVKNANLNKMYDDYAEFDANGAKAKKVRKVLDFLLTAFPDKTPELERYSVISLYAMASHLLERYVFQDRQADLSRWFIQLEGSRRKNSENADGDCDNEMVHYHEKTQHSTDSVESISWRHDFLMQKLFEALPDIEPKDGQRLFTREQRMAIFRRDGGFCQVRIKCAGAKCAWDAWEADHKHPWSRGGKTVVANGQVACLACNSAKGGSIAEPPPAGVRAQAEA